MSPALNGFSIASNWHVLQPVAQRDQVVRAVVQDGDDGPVAFHRARRSSSCRTGCDRHVEDRLVGDLLRLRRGSSGPSSSRCRRRWSGARSGKFCFSSRILASRPYGWLRLTTSEPAGKVPSLSLTSAVASPDFDALHAAAC